MQQAKRRPVFRGRSVLRLKEERAEVRPSTISSTSAAPFYQESLALWRDLASFPAPLARALCGLGEVALAAHDLGVSHAHFAESLTAAREAGEFGVGVLARALEGLGRRAAVQGRHPLMLEARQCSFPATTG